MQKFADDPARQRANEDDNVPPTTAWRSLPRTSAKPGETAAAIKASRGGGGTGLVRTAEKDECPGELLRLLLRSSGNGIQNSVPFVVSVSQVTAQYSVDCRANDSGPGTSSRTCRRPTSPTCSRWPMTC